MSSEVFEDQEPSLWSSEASFGKSALLHSFSETVAAFIGIVNSVQALETCVPSIRRLLVRNFSDNNVR